ncbi:ABC transporter ATP-binding protein [Halorarius halobius]|uniref:ABC transporter ATP-binding protein n=1 Tax=Halorarius halobius TaxID=2962671 RepID=UPI0020CEECC3|nr:ABC transporter ATP-binding protein [Halorarius halobius]
MSDTNPSVAADADGTTDAAQDVSIAVEDLTKVYDGDVLAVDGISFDVAAGDFCVIIGPSGCGKSTTLRSMVGDLSPTSGRIYVDGVDVTETPTYKRDIGLVFQDFQLFPHLTVRENVEYGLERVGAPPAERDEKVEDVLELMKLESLADSPSDELSAGQKQRVALARSLVLEPNVLLLDEPLGDLDYKLQKRLERELLDIHHQVETTFVYVTHDQRQAMRLADQIVVMNDGHVEQSAPSDEIYNHPATAFVATFVGDSNVFTGELTDVVEPGVARMDTPFGTFDVSAENLYSDPEELLGETLPFAVRPQFLRVDETAPNTVDCAVEDVIHQPGKGTKLILEATDADGEPKQLELTTHDTYDSLDERVVAGWDPADTILLERISVTDSVDLERDLLGE